MELVAELMLIHFGGMVLNGIVVVGNRDLTLTTSNGYLTVAPPPHPLTLTHSLTERFGARKSSGGVG